MVDSAVFDEDELNNNVPQRRETFDYIRNNRFNALLDNMKSVKYLAPKWQNLTFKSTTDDSGNKIISQKMNYKAIDEFNEDDVMNDNVFDLSNSQKQKIFGSKKYLRPKPLHMKRDHTQNCEVRLTNLTTKL